jgi:hypothetical protein
MLTWLIVDCTNKKARPAQVSVELPYVARPPHKPTCPGYPPFALVPLPHKCTVLFLAKDHNDPQHTMMSRVLHYLFATTPEGP